MRRSGEAIEEWERWAPVPIVVRRSPWREGTTFIVVPIAVAFLRLAGGASRAGTKTSCAFG